MVSSSFSVVGKIPPQHQVFISFRGKELRGGFVSFLVPALRRENVNLFIDEAEMRSRDLQDLFKRIEESSVVVVIFSELYTESKWCLDELVKINERMIEGKLKVIPIFFKVSVENVKILEGKFGMNFRKTKRKHEGELVRIRNWEEALHSITQKFGLPSSQYRTDYDLLNAIVVEVKKLLNHIPTEEVVAAKVNDYTKVHNPQVPGTKNMLVQGSTQMSSSEEEENVIVSAKEMDRNQKRKKDCDQIIEPEDHTCKSENSAKLIGKLIRFTGEGEEKKEHYQKFEFNGKQYGLEDSVLIAPAVPTRKLYAAIIKDIYNKKGKEGNVYLEVQWFYRLEDLEKIDGGSWGTRDSRVLFYSFHGDEIFAESVRTKCTVHFVPGGKQIPSPATHPGFIVQNVYDFVNKKLRNLTDKDFVEKQKHEIDLLVAKTMLRLGDLPDIDKDQNIPKLTGKRSAPKRRKILVGILRNLF